MDCPVFDRTVIFVCLKCLNVNPLIATNLNSMITIWALNFYLVQYMILHTKILAKAW